MLNGTAFQKLTCGVKFSKNAVQQRKRKAEPVIVLPPKIKLEVKLEAESDEEASPVLNHKPFDTREIKEEVPDEESSRQAIEQPTIKDEPESDVRLVKPEVYEKMHEERVNRIRNIYRIRVKKGKYSEPIPGPIESFEEMLGLYGVSNRLMINIHESGYRKPTPVQMQAIPLLLMKTNVMVCAPTGSGKTAAFLVPIIHHLEKPLKCGFRALVICPTRELAKQTQREALRLSEEMALRTHVITKVNEHTDYSFEGRKFYDILVTTPQRICYMLSQKKRLINLSNVEWVVIDEADKLFEDSRNSFREQLLTILYECSNPSKVVALFSATNTHQVTKWAREHLKQRIGVTIGAMNSAVDLVKQELVFVGNESGKLMAFRDMVGKGLSPPVLVFVQSKDRAVQLYSELIYDGLNVDVIHSDRSQRERDAVVQSYREGRIWILICTELMSRGIDFKGVEMVVNYDFPPSAISYVHRIGRTGRAGRTGQAVTYFTREDRTNLKEVAEIVKRSGSEVPDYMLGLKKTSKQSRDKALKKAPRRAAIRTEPGFETQERARKKKMVRNSKAKQMKQGKMVRKDK